jgi:DNA damage-binding protein 1
VFAASDRPTVVYCTGHKLVYANVNSGEVTSMCPFHSEPFPECLALATETSLTIGTMNEIQKLQVRRVVVDDDDDDDADDDDDDDDNDHDVDQIKTMKLGESPRRIAYNSQGRVFAVCTAKYITLDSGEEEQDFIRFLDDASGEEVAKFELPPYEMGISIVSCTFNKDPREYVVVGTAVANPDEDEPRDGRLLVFAMGGDGNRDLQLVSEKGTKGAVYVLNAFNGKLLAGINSKVQLYRWAEKEGAPELQTECGHHGHILAMYMQSRGDFIIVGDLMRSISLLMYKQIDGTIEEIAKDYSPHWMTAVDMIDDDIFVGAENRSNMFTVRPEPTQPVISSFAAPALPPPPHKPD